MSNTAWQPIETAPKTDEYVDLWYDGFRVCDARRVDLGNGNVFYEAPGWSCIRRASHWMPTPKAPNSVKSTHTARIE